MEKVKQAFLCLLSNKKTSTFSMKNKQTVATEHATMPLRSIYYFLRLVFRQSSSIKSQENQYNVQFAYF